MKLLIDTNVILDMVLKRNGCDISMELFRKIKKLGASAYITASSVTQKDIQDAFGQKWKDFEDCVQYVTGKSNKMNYIITVNRKDYKDVLLPVMTPTAWIDMINVKRMAYKPQRDSKPFYFLLFFSFTFLSRPRRELC